MKKARVTQTDIARVAGVHNTTVSLALRNSPALPEATRDRIQALAKSMGYSPDPMLQALIAYRNGHSPKRQQETIAYITAWTTKSGWRSDAEEGKYYIGAERKAAECGYHLEHFSLAEPGMTQRRLSDMLYHRGIKGAVFAAHSPQHENLMNIDWARFSSVKIGCLPRVPALHRVANDYYSATRMAVRNIVRAGYKRIGLVAPRTWDDRVEQAWSSAYLTEVHRANGATALPILYTGDATVLAMEETSRSELHRWVTKYRPDVVLGPTSTLRDLARQGWSIPTDIAFANLSLEDSEDGIAGLSHNREKVGEMAIELLLTQLERNLRGIPSAPTTTLVESVWRAGESLPELAPLVELMEAKQSLDNAEYHSAALAAVGSEA